MIWCEEITVVLQFRRNLTSLILLVLYFIGALQLVGINSGNSDATSHNSFSRKLFIKGNHVFLQSPCFVQWVTSKGKVKPYAKDSMVQKCLPFANGSDWKKISKRERKKRKGCRNVQNSKKIFSQQEFYRFFLWFPDRWPNGM